MNKKEDIMIDANNLYQLLSQKLEHSESVSWSRFHYFLIFNSILILAWTTVITADPQIDNASSVLSLISFLGIISGLFWAGLGYRGRAYLKEYIAQGKKLENNTRLWPSDLESIKPFTKESKKHPFHICRSTVILTVMPLIVAFTHLVLLIKS